MSEKDGYDVDCDTPQDIEGLEVALEESAKIINPKVALVKSLFKLYTESLIGVSETRINLDYEKLLEHRRALENIIVAIKCEKKELEALILLKNRKKEKTLEEEKFLKIVKRFLQKAEMDRKKYDFS